MLCSMSMAIIIFVAMIAMAIFSTHHNKYAAMDGGERRGRHVQGWTFDPQLRQHKKRAGVVGGVHNRTPPAAQAKK